MRSACVIPSILLDLLYCIRSPALAKVCEAVSLNWTKALGCLDYFMERTWTVSGAAIHMLLKYVAVLLGTGLHAGPIHCTAVTCDCCSQCSVMSLWCAGLCRQVVA